MRHKTLKQLLFLILVGLAGLAAYLYFQPVPTVGPQVISVVPPATQAINLPWPATGQAAIGADGYGVLASHNNSGAVPIASLAKVITALAVLQKKPLALSTQGPELTIDSTDVGYYNNYFSQGGSVAKVSLGEKLSEYQALQAMLIPSGNNMADSLARWIFGSPEAYVAYANQMISTMGLSKTLVGDASGFGDSTTSTADELVKIGLKALQNPVIAQIVGQPTATLPVAGEIKNVNWLLGDSGVVGIKTGNTDKAGGCYLFAANRQVQGHQITVVGAVLGTPQLNDAIAAAKTLLQASDNDFSLVAPIHKGDVLATYHTAWGVTARATASKDLSLLVWKGKDIKIVNEPDSLSSPVKSGAAAGIVSLESSGQTTKTNLTLTQNLPAPSIFWRIFHN
jgi:D-alanyl-D-alanine carboxypeptidase (penicillin-binding protein 5/6)